MKTKIDTSFFIPANKEEFEEIKRFLVRSKIWTGMKTCITYNERSAFHALSCRTKVGYSFCKVRKDGIVTKEEYLAILNDYCNRLKGLKNELNKGNNKNTH